MPYCERCGGEISPDDTFCTHCGTDLSSSPDAHGGPGAAEPEDSRRSDRTGGHREQQSNPRRGRRDNQATKQAGQGAAGGRRTNRQTGGDGSRRKRRRRRGRDKGQESRPEPREPRTNISAYTIGQKFVAVGAVVAIVGAFLPWLTVDALGTSLSKTGVDGDGVFTLCFALVAVGLLVYQGPGRWGKGVLAGCFILGLLIALLGTAYIYDPWLGAEQPTETERALIDVGTGLYLTAASGYIIIGGMAYDLLID